MLHRSHIGPCIRLGELTAAGGRDALIRKGLEQMLNVAFIRRKGILRQEQHELTRRLPQGCVPCPAVVKLVAGNGHNPRTVRASQFRGAIRGPRIHHQNFLRRLRLVHERSKQRGNFARRVERGKNHGNAHCAMPSPPSGLLFAALPISS